jgi:GNAT superfamily N-acetyltransferase
MPEKNLLRMIQLAEEAFEMKNDPSQLSIDESTMEEILRLHPAAISEKRDDDGPIAWLIVLPTTSTVMERFLSGEISERQILAETDPDDQYDALYLCSVLLLPEYRGKGIARALCSESIQTILRDHPIRTLFCWTFSDEGGKLAGALAEEFHLPLRLRTHDV